VSTVRHPDGGTPAVRPEGRAVFGETWMERFHVCPARSIHRDAGVKRREWPSHILGSETLG